ncbi:hypothetical protein Efla_005531 [Eimeria flavescens]
MAVLSPEYCKMPLPLTARRRLAHFFVSVAQLEGDIEALRAALAYRPTFKPQNAFAAMDPLGNGFLTSGDLQRYLRRHGAALTDSAAYNLLRRLDSDGNGKVSFCEFRDFVLPSDATEREALLSRDQRLPGVNNSGSYCCCCCIAEATEPCCCKKGDSCTSQLLLREVDVHHELNILRQILAGSPGFKLLAAFQFVEDPNIGAVTPASLAEALEGEGFALRPSELQLIFRRLDSDGDGRLNYVEFVDAVMPSNCSASLLTSDAPSLVSQNALTRYLSCTVKFTLKDSLTVAMVPAAALALKLPSVGNVSCACLPEKPRCPGSSARTGEHQQYCGRLRCNSSSNLHQVFSPATEPSRSSDCLAEPSRAHCPRRCNTSHYSCTFCAPGESRRTFLSRSNASRLRSKSCSSNLVASGCEVAGVLSLQIDSERRLECLREKLALKPDFNLLQFWGLFDTDARGYATATHIKDAFNALGLNISLSQAGLFARKLNNDAEPCIRYADMARAFLPTKTRYAEAMINRISTGSHKCSTPQRHLAPETLEIVAAIFDMTLAVSGQQGHHGASALKSEEQAELSRHRMCVKDLSSAFQDLDTNGDGYVTAAEFSASLMAHGMRPSEAEVNALVNRYDKNGDSKVSYTEFVNEIGRTRCPIGSCRLVCLCR